MHLLVTFFRTYLRQSIMMMLALLLAGIVEGFGLMALLPLLTLTVGGDVGGMADSPAGQAVVKYLAAVGLQPKAGILLLVIVLAVFLKSFLVLLAKKRVGYTVAHVATDLRLGLIRALLAARWEFYVGQPAGSQANAMATEAMRASEAYLCAATMVAKLLQSLVYIVVALLVSWKATSVSLLTGVFFLLMFSRLVKKARRAGSKQTALLQKLLSQLTDSMQAIKPMKAMAREHVAEAIMVTQTTGLNKALRKQVLSKESLKALQEPMITMILVIGLYVPLVYLHIPMASVMVLVFLLARILTQLGSVQQQYQKMVIFESAYWSLVAKIQAAKKEREPVMGAAQPTLNRGVYCRNISFAYDDVKVFDDVSMEFPCQSFTALVGPSGGGKTTIADLLTGLCRPQQGEIYVDDLALHEVDVRQWRRMIGYVPQETLLLHDSVFANVTVGETGIGEPEVIAALQAAGAWEFVSAMPQGIYSDVGERGGKLSGGQRQRLAIARALVHKPRLLILDEATSALDRVSEEAICQTLQTLRHELIILAISHQPTMVAAADRTYRLENGKIFLSVE
ncbi:MAG: ABC transporter ATP-binding protein [Deltaproteobacteria bacterium]|nr:ABC transporter ATP-binding protein [Candidatus Anaeroferrophillus wilburensis]MBN2889921.1 ABC transporter ATP-binding protein [Deltaproteobacteria bacterium]